jgi:hypothetical protein
VSATQAEPDERDVPAQRAAIERTLMESARAVLAALALLAFAGFMTKMALGFGVEARRLPITVGLPLTIMALINLALVVRTELLALGRLPERFALAPQAAAAAGADLPAPVLLDGGAVDGVEAQQVLKAVAAGEIGLEEATDEGLSFLGAIFSVAVVTGLFFLLGLIPAAVIYTIGFMKGVGKESWTKSIVVTTALIFMFWVFRNYLNVRFYRGWLVTEEIIPYVLPF